MKISEYILLGALVLCTGLFALFFFSGPPGDDTPAAAESAAGARHVRDSPATARDRSEVAGPSTPKHKLAAGPEPAVGPRLEPDGGLAQDAPDRTERAGLAGAPGERDAEPVEQLPLPEGTGRVDFTVEDVSGQPAAGVTVFLRALEPSQGADQADTSGRGEARFDAVAAGAYSYRLREPGRDDVAAAGSLQLQDGEWKQLTVRLGAPKSSIEGHVRNQAGEAVPGLEIRAVRHRLASAVSEDVSEAQPKSTRSRSDGSFAISDLPEGEYQIRTSATERYPATQLLVQAGAGPVDLVVVEGLRVYGTVTDERGSSLARAQVRVQGGGARLTLTDDQGSYQLDLEQPPGGDTPSLRFSLSGYENEERAVTAPGPDGRVRLDVALRPLEDAAEVSGVVQSERGDPIAGATVFLFSPQLATNYQTASDSDGSFLVAAAKVGHGYQLRVLPAGRFQDFSQTNILVTEEGLSLEVVLEPLPTGRLSGRMIDTEGAPVSGLRIWLLASEGTRSAVPITSDESGFFAVEQAPAGPLRLDTRTPPRLLVTGPELSEGGDRDVVLVIDAGDRVLTGQVLDDRGEPVAAADVALMWSHSARGLKSTSERETRTDTAGYFRFARLGPGEHLLEVRAPGYGVALERPDVSSNAAEVEVRLERSRP